MSTRVPRPEAAVSLPIATAAAFARVALANIDRAYPHKLDHLLTGPEPAAADHVALHPVFFGSYDWHSSVHMHWLLVRMLRLHPDLAEAPRVAACLERQLTPSRLAREQAYLADPSARTFERPYGWAWLLELRAELERLATTSHHAMRSRAAGWAAAVDPLARDLAARLGDFVRAAPYPVRTGTHGSTAFAAILALDYAATLADPILEADLIAAARRWHLADRDAPIEYEPSLTDFLSPTLTVAGLVQRALDPDAFASWLPRFLPRGLGPLATPPQVPDRLDPQIAHLDGLALSRAWMARRIAAGLAPDESLRGELEAAADRHLAVALPCCVGGEYVGEHWLASFAALALGEQP
jgi:hypothetical protein